MRSAVRHTPALTLMGLIFLLSSRSDLPHVEGSFDVVLRKAAHMTEYGLLWTLWLWAQPGPRAPAARRALAIALAYAASDELHQSFVDSRHASPFDVAIDAAGVGVAAAIWVVVVSRARLASCR